MTTDIRYINITKTDIEGWEKIDPVADLPLEDSLLYMEVRYLGSREDYPTIVEFIVACEHKGINVRYVYKENISNIIDFKCALYGNSALEWTCIIEEDRIAHKALYKLAKITI